MFVEWLDDPRCQRVGSSGGKAANLSRMAAKFPVPPGFCVTADAHRRWSASGRPPDLPADVERAVFEAYAVLGERGGEARPRVAVRSSAIAEDGPTSSFAGMYRTLLNVAGPDEVATSIVACWESGQRAQVRAYRQRAGAAGDDVMAVLVQQLVVADVAFVAFSVDPVSGDDETVVVNSSWGLGECIVDGAVVPDSYSVNKADGVVTGETISEKSVMTVVRPTGMTTVAVPRALRRQGTLSAAQAGQVARLAARLEGETGGAVDFEGAFRDGELFLLQCRPITTLKDLRPQGSWSR